MEKKNVGIWIRVSTEEQAKGESPETHERRARLYAESKGWNVVTVYHLEALSGKSVMGYAETKRMLADIRNKSITGIIFSKLARLARNTKELLEFAEIFKKEDADLICLQEAIDTSSPAGRLFYTMIAAMAQFEREEVASRVSASIATRAQMGKQIGGKPSLGYKWEDGKLVLDEKYAPVRKLVFELFQKHKRKKTVARMLNEGGYRTRSGKKFTDSTVIHLLRDPMAKGIRRSNFTHLNDKGKQERKPASEWMLHPCPAIVSEELWDDCNKLLDESLIKNKRKGPRAKHLLAGFVGCADCGKKMYVFHSTKTPRYRCANCGNHISTTDLEEIYHEQLKTFLLTDISVSQYLESLDMELQEKQRLLSIATTERDSLSKKMDTLLELRMNNELSKEVFSQKYRPLEERLLQITGQLPELEAEIDFLRIQHRSGDVVLRDATDLYSCWNTLEFGDKRMIIEAITESVSVGRTDIHIKLSYLPTKPIQSHTADPTPNSGNSSDSSYLRNPVKRHDNGTMVVQ